jgi:hypothetical protein
MAEPRKLQITRRTPARDAHAATTTDRLRSLGRLISYKERAIARMKAELASLHTEAEAALAALGQTTFAVEQYGTHEVYTPRSNSSTQIDKAAVVALVGEHRFCEIADVSIAALRAELSSKDFAAVTTSVPGTPKEPQYRFLPLLQQKPRVPGKKAKDMQA